MIRSKIVLYRMTSLTNYLHYIQNNILKSDESNWTKLIMKYFIASWKQEVKNEMIKLIKINIFWRGKKLNNLKSLKKLKYHQIRSAIKSISVIIFLTRHLFVEIWDDSLITDKTLKDLLNIKPVFDSELKIIINFDSTINIKSEVYIKTISKLSVLKDHIFFGVKCKVFQYFMTSHQSSIYSQHFFKHWIVLKCAKGGIKKPEVVSFSRINHTLFIFRRSIIFIFHSV